MRPKCRGTAVLQLLTLLSALIVQFHSQAKAQAMEAEQAAIRAALTKWTGDFNAGNVDMVCGLFARGLCYEYRGFPERGYQEMCDGLRNSLTDKTKSYNYSLDIKEVILSSDLAVVRLVWTLRSLHSAWGCAGFARAGHGCLRQTI